MSVFSAVLHHAGSKDVYRGTGGCYWWEKGSEDAKKVRDIARLCVKVINSFSTYLSSPSLHLSPSPHCPLTLFQPTNPLPSSLLPPSISRPPLTFPFSSHLFLPLLPSPFPPSLPSPFPPSLPLTFPSLPSPHLSLPPSPHISPSPSPHLSPFSLTLPSHSTSPDCQLALILL